MLLCLSRLELLHTPVCVSRTFSLHTYRDMQMYKYATNLTNVAKRPQSGAKCTKKTTRPTGPTSGGGRWIGQGWMGPKGRIAGVNLSRPLQTTGQHSGVQLLTRNHFIPISTQVNFNRVELYRLNSAQRNHRPHRPNCVIPTIHWLQVHFVPSLTQRRARWTATWPA